MAAIEDPGDEVWARDCARSILVLIWYLDLTMFDVAFSLGRGRSGLEIILSTENLLFSSFVTPRLKRETYDF